MKIETKTEIACSNPVCGRKDGIKLEFRAAHKYALCMLCGQEWTVEYSKEEINAFRS
jgi:hypothetical protein